MADEIELKEQCQLTDIIQQTAELSEHTKDFLKSANYEQLQSLVKAYLANETLQTFSKFVHIAVINTNTERAKFLEGFKSLATKDAYNRAIERLERYAITINKSILELNFADADDFILSLQNDRMKNYSSTTDRAAASIRRDIAAVSSFFSFLERRHDTIRNPFKGTKARPKQKAKRLEQYPTMQEMNIILESLPPRTRAAVYIMAYRGLRIGALPTLKIKNDIFTAESKGKEVKGTFDKSIIAEIKKAKLNKSMPFDYLCKPLSNGKERKTTPEQCLKMQIQAHLKKLFKAGKVSAIFSAHDFRHFYAVQEYEKDKDIYRVSKLLNHSNIAITETYLKGLNVIL